MFLPKASFPTTKKIWFNGRLVNWAKASTHVLTHALHYGSGVFEGIRFYETSQGPAIFRLKEHVERLFYSAQTLEMKIPYTKKQIAVAIIQTVKINKVKSGYIRPLAYFGYGKMGLNPVGAPVDIAIACWPWGSYLGGQPIKVKISKYIRIHPQSLNADAKVCGHYVNSILASLEIHKDGYDEALLLDYRGYIAEGPGENIFLLKKGILYTPKLGTILKGITRDTIIRMARGLKIKVKEGNFKPKDLYQADEAFFVGTAAEVQPIGSIDRKKISTGKIGPTTSKIRNLYLDIVTGKEKKYRNFLTFVNV